MSVTVEKYIYQSPQGYKVDIRKAGKRFTSTFSFRLFQNKNEALEAAISWRDRIHELEFKCPVSKTAKHGKSRNPKTHECIDDLQFRMFPGMYLERVKSNPRYFTVNKSGKKHRFSISRLGLVEAYICAVNLNLHRA